MWGSLLTESLVLLFIVSQLLEHVERLAHQALAYDAEHLGPLEDLTPNVEGKVLRVDLFVTETTRFHGEQCVFIISGYENKGNSHGTGGEACTIHF